MNDISSSIWPRVVTAQGVPKTYYSVAFERSYKVNDEFHYTRSFDPESLPRLLEVIRQTEVALRELASA